MEGFVLSLDLFSACISCFYFFLEDIGLMNPDNDVNLHVIHYIFLPIIQHQLDVFQDAWACPSLLRTERNRIPHQLLVLGLPMLF